jgi:branched-chain amino acid transport system substrate-binding protein
MKVENPVRSSPRPWSLMVALLAAVLLVALAAACGGNDEEGPGATSTPVGTGTPTGAGSPTAATPAAAAPGISDKEILLGAEVILSGSMGAVYATVPKATNAYFKYINETQGGVCGRKIVYQYEDNKDDPAFAVEVARKLVEQDKIFAMVGSLGDSPHPASWEYLNEKGVPDILVSAAAHRFGADAENHPWTVQMIPSYFVEGVLFGKYISENLPGKTVAVLHGDNAGGLDAMNGLKDGLDPSKNEIVGEEIAEYAAISINSQIANLKKSNADVMVAFSSPGFAAQALKVADRMGWHPQWFIDYTSADDMMFQFVSPKLLEGAITFQATKMADWRDDPAVAEHYDIMQKYGGPAPSNFTIYAQVLAETAVDILSRTCDNLTRDGLMQAVESTTNFHTDLMLDEVSVSFSDTDHTGLQTGRMLKATVAANGKGKWEYFGPLVQFK